MTSGPRISVVVPAYNSAWSIGRTIRSILSQSLSDFELIIINDGSTDNIHAIIDENVKADPRVRVIDQSNAGLAAARNRGIKEAACDIIALLDADDVWHHRFLEKTADALDKSPKAPFAYAWSLRMDEDDHVLSATRWARPPRHDLIGLLTVNSVGNGSAALFRREALLAAGGFDETLRVRHATGAEDWKLCLQLAASGEPAIVPENLVGYRLVRTSMSQAAPRLQLRSVLGVMEDIRRQFPHIPARHFADARTAMIGWLLPAFVRGGAYGALPGLVFRAYACNPLWFRVRDLRALHVQKLRAIARALLGRILRSKAMPQPHLGDLIQDGERPFAALLPENTQARP